MEFDALYDELAQADGEHTDVGIKHESGWALSAFPGGLVVFENVETDGGIGPRHLQAATREKVLRLWNALAKGNLKEMEMEEWQRGYG
jgi:hypothetical protein